jgi:hypothetical protein
MRPRFSAFTTRFRLGPTLFAAFLTAFAGVRVYVANFVVPPTGDASTILFTAARGLLLLAGIYSSSVGSPWNAMRNREFRRT